MESIIDKIKKAASLAAEDGHWKVVYISEYKLAPIQVETKGETKSSNLKEKTKEIDHLEKIDLEVSKSKELSKEVKEEPQVVSEHKETKEQQQDKKDKKELKVENSEAPLVPATVTDPEKVNYLHELY